MDWIDVNDRLPDRTKDILAYHDEWGTQLVYFNSHYNFILIGLYDSKATHWMPLPEPPSNKD